MVDPMSIQAARYSDEDGLYDPDEVQVPESSVHRTMTTLIEVACAHLLGEHGQVHADLNWYPADDGTAVAPDVMVFAPGAFDRQAKSYRQGSAGPTAIAVVEVPSPTDDYGSFMAKQFRYQALGTVVFVVTQTEPPHITRLGLDDETPRKWLGRPCPELGGLVFKVDDDRLAVWLPGDVTVSSAAELVDLHLAATTIASQRADSAELRADSAELRAERLAAQLRAAGVEPEV